MAENGVILEFPVWAILSLLIVGTLGVLVFLKKVTKHSPTEYRNLKKETGTRTAVVLEQAYFERED